MVLMANSQFDICKPIFYSIDFDYPKIDSIKIVDSDCQQLLSTDWKNVETSL